MLLSIHATAGALIGQQINNPILAFVLAFISHFILDVIPHGDHDWIEDYKGGQKNKAIKIISIVVIDVLVLLTLLISKFYFKSFTPNLPIIAGVVGGVLPDFLVGCHELSDKLFKRFYRLHFVVHDLLKFKPSTASGIFMQVVVLAVLLLNF